MLHGLDWSTSSVIINLVDLRKWIGLHTCSTIAWYQSIMSRKRNADAESHSVLGTTIGTSMLTSIMLRNTHNNALRFSQHLNKQTRSR
jgi:hypothetical protein